MLTISIVTQMVAKGMLFTRFGLPPNIINNPNANGTKKSIEISNDNMWTFSLCFVSLFIFSSYVKNMFRIYQSETFVVLDCQYIDKCTSSDHANWNSTTGFTWSDGKCTITVSSSSFLRIVTSIVGDFEATFKAKNDAIRLVMYNASNVSQSRQWTMSATTDEVYYNINRVGSTWTAKTSTDGTNWTNLTERSDDTDLTTEDVYFGFIIATSTERSITYTDLKVYPI